MGGGIGLQKVPRGCRSWPHILPHVLGLSYQPPGWGRRGSTFPGIPKGYWLGRGWGWGKGLGSAGYWEGGPQESPWWPFMVLFRPHGGSGDFLNNTLGWRRRGATCLRIPKGCWLERGWLLTAHFPPLASLRNASLSQGGEGAVPGWARSLPPPHPHPWVGIPSALWKAMLLWSICLIPAAASENAERAADANAAEGNDEQKKALL